MKLMIYPCHYEIFTLWNMTYPHFYNLQSHENLKEFCVIIQSFTPCYIKTIPMGEDHLSRFFFNNKICLK